LKITLDRDEVLDAIRSYLEEEVNFGEDATQKMTFTFYNREGDLWCVECEEPKGSEA